MMLALLVAISPLFVLIPAEFVAMLSLFVFISAAFAVILAELVAIVS